MLNNSNKMFEYEYQVLRYIHDIMTEEFVNVGLIIYAPKLKYLNSKSTYKYSRFSSLYGDLPGKYIVKNIKHFENMIDTYSNRINSEVSFKQYNSIIDITSRILPKDNSSLQLSEIKKGLTLDINRTFEEIFYRYIGKFEKTIIKKSRSDDDAWKNVYKKYFKKYEIDKNLTTHIINTKQDKFIFDYSIKNGVYHCYQPISFDLLDATDIKEKTYKWFGKLNILSTSEEKFKLSLLTLFPRDRDKSDLVNWVISLLETQKKNIQMEIVKESLADKYFEEEKKELNMLHNK